MVGLLNDKQIDELGDPRRTKVLKFQAECSCGFKGKLRLDQLTAGADLEAHLEEARQEHVYWIQPKERTVLNAARR